ncbi:MAG: ABC transporter [Desulfuromonas sp.]|uniref:ABC transporter permease n=1 Tax=Desulfuromonas sp. TaxID=892 RepID=UPI000CA8E370|nr:ABC transporter permease [Desulfuromonas sp.]PLX84418.1 MAG: ABC transporter [Desulfuromonas sp.]
MNLFHFFSLVNTQARMALKAEASKFVLSYLWWVIEPLLFVLIYYLVFEVLLGRGRDDFLLFLICGKIPYLWFQKGVVSASNSIVQNKGLINQVEMPKALFPYASVQEAMYKQWVVFLVLFGVVTFYGFRPELNWLWLAPVVIVQYALILACSLLGALCVSFYGDFRMVINMGMLFLMFSSGLFWDVNDIADPATRDLLFACNPLAFLIDAYRQVLMGRTVYDLEHMAVLAGVIAVALLIMHIVLHKMSRIIAARVVNS